MQQIIIQREEEHEHEEESIASQEVPDIMVIKEPKKKALSVETSWLSSRNQGALFLALEEEEGGAKAKRAEYKEDNTVSDKPLATEDLHEDVEDGVADQVAKENIQHDWW